MTDSFTFDYAKIIASLETKALRQHNALEATRAQIAAFRKLQDQDKKGGK